MASEDESGSLKGAEPTKRKGTKKGAKKPVPKKAAKKAAKKK